jgi:hypothetical protein
MGHGMRHGMRHGMGHGMGHGIVVRYNSSKEYREPKGRLIDQ